MLNEQHLSGCQTHTDGEEEEEEEEDECARCPECETNQLFEPEACVSYLFHSNFVVFFSPFFFFFANVNLGSPSLLEAKEAL